MRRIIGAAEIEEIVFTRGATEAISLVGRSWGDTHLRPGDEIVVTEMEHHANIVPWQQAAARTGATIRWWPIRDDGVLEEAGLEDLLTDRTRLLAIAAASNVLGTINPLAEIIPRAHAAGALVMVDAAQFVPHMAIDVQQLDADFVAFSGHKMLAPAGVGVLYAKRRLLKEVPPFLGGGGMIRRVDMSGFEATETPAKCEAGTPSAV